MSQFRFKSSIYNLERGWAEGAVQKKNGCGEKSILENEKIKKFFVELKN
jgi:hypothetical protein